ncbi:ABC transporter substrate-binding protein [Streptomyces albipurpureus]|uniref:ABC transporter substrate-binding protein n=1 Tax=Streptomyces albipurpureus TaxID=2897419 RepID=A0ABT0UUE7_9ACTN|nr:ABC transporter substrate-binding protein [Streptomyces sp. CWNU-1]MCM2391866.1 ABC transporter substrate-binding protein [Streptomyces sp. CWNU-1]
MNVSPSPRGAALTRASKTERTLVSAMVSVALLALSACGSDADSGQDRPGSKPKAKSMTVGYLPLADYLPIFVAVEEGYFAAEGLDVKTKQMPPGSPVAPTVGGSFDVGGIPWSAYLLAADGKVPLTPIMGATSGVPTYASFVVPKSSTIKKPADLVGKTAAVTGAPGMCNMLLDTTLEKQGFKRDKANTKYVQLAPAEMKHSLDDGEVDAACVPQPVLGGLLASGGYRIVFDAFSGPFEGFPLVGYNTRTAYAKANPDTIAAFRRAVVKATETIEARPEVVTRVLPTYTSFKAEQIKSLVLPDFTPDIDQKDLEELAGIMRDLGVVDHEISVPKIGN